MRKWFSPWATEPVPVPENAPETLPAPVPAPPRPNRPRGTRKSPKRLSEPPEAFLGPQIAAELHKLKAEHGITKLASACGVTPNTMVRCLSGVGMKLSTFEKVCQVAGWTVEIRDPDGTVIARL